MTRKVGEVEGILKARFTSFMLTPCDKSRNCKKDNCFACVAGTIDSLYDPQELTPRETAVIKAVADGKSNKEIADLLAISETTVKAHLRSILVKLVAKNRSQAAVIFSKSAEAV